jgi:hypothetical protein
MNRRILAAQLRRRATRIDRSVWNIERVNRALNANAIRNLRHDAQALRRLADQIAPKK